MNRKKSPVESNAAGAGSAAPADLSAIAGPLLEWYRANRRTLPFREDPTPYHVWVSEVMLQQTQMATALPYYTRFIAELPDAAALAACDEERLHKLWQGLGYYSRARNMRRAARVLVEQHGGELPADYSALRALPGIGDYTAGAIASIAFGLPHPAVDGNVLRVAARLLACSADITQPATKLSLTAAVQAALPNDTPGDFNQALMELGALVCIPKTPACPGCPLARLCRGHRAGLASDLPVKTRAAKKPQIPVCVLVVHSGDRVLLQRRPPSGLLAGLWQPLLLEGEFTKQQAQHALQRRLPNAQLGKALPNASHTFTHKVWQLYGWLCNTPADTPPPAGEYRFVTPGELHSIYTLPRAFSAYESHMLRPQG